MENIKGILFLMLYMTKMQEILLADSTIDLLLMLTKNSMNVDPLLCTEMDGK